MDRELTRKGAWSKDLNPKSIVGFDEGVGYLDRMIAGGDHFLPSRPKRSGGNENENKNKNHKHKNQQSHAKKNPQIQTPIVNIDYASWVADRKRKFPKISTDNNEPDLSEMSPSKNSHEQPNKIGNSSAIPKRKKTLFEKLIEMDQQSTE